MTSGWDDELAAGSDREPDPRRARRARVAGAAFLVAAAVIVSVVRPDLGGLLAAKGPTPSASRSGGPSPTDGPLIRVAWDIRGDLARDRGFVAAAVARIRSQRPDMARLFFAGRLPDGSRLVLAGTDVGRGVVATAVHSMLVDPGQDVGEAAVTELSPLTDPQQVLAWAGKGRDGHVYAVLLSRPGPVRFELSPKVRFRADGSPRRIWTPVYTEDGVAVTDLGQETDPVVTVRASGSGVFPVPALVAVSELALPGTVLVVGVEAPDYAGPEAGLLMRELQRTAGPLADLAASDLRVLWSGALWTSRRLALVLVTRPDGVRLQALLGQDGDVAFPVGVRALPTGAPDVLPYLLEPFSPQDPTYLICPTGAGTVVYRRPGRPTKRLRVNTTGALALIAPGPGAPSVAGARVTLLDRDGRRILTTTLPRTGFDDPLRRS